MYRNSTYSSTHNENFASTEENRAIKNLESLYSHFLHRE
jgi:hypothetical protein